MGGASEMEEVGPNSTSSAPPPTPPSLDGALHLRRFIHLGQEAPLYQPQDRLKMPSFEKGSLSAVEQLIADGKGIEILQCINNAHRDGLCLRPALIFALAVATKQSAMVVKSAAYEAVRSILQKPQDLFLFIRFSEALSHPQKGWGRGLRRAVGSWYSSKDPLELARMVSSVRNHYKWSHRDLLKLAHPKPKDPAHLCVLKYVMNGLAEAQKEYGETAEALPVLAFLQVVEDVKHGQDEHQVARLLESHALEMEVVPTNLLKSKEVWTALLGRLPLGTILQNLRRLALLGFLKPGCPLLPHLMDALKNTTTIAQSGLYPAQVFVAMQDYEQMGKPPPKVVSKSTTATTTAPPKPPVKKKMKNPPKPNPKVLEVLNQLFVATLQQQQKGTGLRYLVAVDVRNPMVHGKCYRSPGVSPAQAATLITLSLLAAEKNVSVVAFSQPDMILVDLPADVTMQEAAKKFRETPMGACDMAKPLQWAQTNKMAFDVFVLVTDNQVKVVSVPLAAAFQQYRQAMQLPHAKLVVCALGMPKFSLASPDDPGMLDVAGFDEKVPRMIEAFARGFF